MMAGRGPSPKMSRSRRQAPTRGEWITLEPLSEPVLPPLDELQAPEACGGTWPYTSRLYWEAWRESPVSALWTPDDIALAVDTICGHAEAAAGGRGAQPSEIRLRQESLGLTPKGRRDNRYLLPSESPSAELASIQDAPSAGKTLPEAI